jgi:hypothetical protein
MSQVPTSHKPRLRRLVWWLQMAVSCAVFVLPLTRLPAQGRREIPDKIVCTECRIELTRLVTFGAADDTAFIRQNDLVARNSRGEFVLASVEDGRIYLFDQRGRLLRSAGRRGKGQGEYYVITTIRVSAGDTIHVFDSGNARRTVLSPGLQVVRETPLPTETSRNQSHLFADGRVVLNAAIATRERVGLPIHLLDANGRILRSFGAESAAVAPNARPEVIRRAMTRAGADRIWSARTREYVLELFGLDGTKQGELVRRAAWFQPDAGLLKGSRGAYPRPPSPHIQSMWQDANGLLWVLSLLADKDWKAGLREVRHENGGSGYELANAERHFDSILEVIDPRTGRLVSSRRFDAMLSFLTDDGLAIGARADDDGVEYVDVWQISLRGPYKTGRAPLCPSMRRAAELSGPALVQG